jgi:HD-GYP domain-containing protein (c-di-GMP phosphodiesterase class II)
LKAAATSLSASARSEGRDLSATAPHHARIPILYVILGVLLVISIVPMYFYSAKVESINGERLKTNEQLLQNTVTRSLADDLAQHQRSLRMMLANLSSAIQIASGGDLSETNIHSPELRALLEHFASSDEEIAYATLLNSDAKGIYSGTIVPDAFLNRELERAYSAAREGREYNGQALVVGEGKSARTVFLVSYPVKYGDRFLGMIATVVDLQFLIRRLQEVAGGGLTPYVVDSQGRLVAAATPGFATGQDMKNLDIVRTFVGRGNKARFAETREFTMGNGFDRVAMLGTFSPVMSLNWAVVVQKPSNDAYRDVIDMQGTARLLALVAVLISILVSIFAARRITNPLQVLTQSSRALARGDFSQRVNLLSRTEIGELANTFNTMSDELEHFIEDLKRAAEENRELFMGSIQMLAGAVDEKDPYTRGHSDRVTRYSLMIAEEMKQPSSFLETLRVSAQLHDVGKIGIEDHILKKPGALTEEEFEVMKTHTTKGANILRPVTQLAEMLPGIELHHEALDGRGYPYGLQGDQIPLLARVIAVADTFDALTTNRPYQQAHTPDQALQIIKNLAGKRLDPEAVAALLAVYAHGDIKIQRFTIKRPIAAPPVETPAVATVTAVAAAPATPAATAPLERTRI